MPPLLDEDFEAWEAIHDRADRPYTCIMLWAYHSVQDREDQGDVDPMTEFCRLLAIDSQSEQAEQLWDIAHRAYIFEWNDEGWQALMGMVNKGWELWSANGYGLNRRTA